MDSQDCQYIRIKNELVGGAELQDFTHRLNTSLISVNPYYLALLLMTIVESPTPKPLFIESLIQKGANANFTQPKGSRKGSDVGKTVLMVACERTVSVNVNALFKFNGLQMDRINIAGETAIFYAICNKNEEQSLRIIKILLKKDPNLSNKANLTGETPLAWAFMKAKLKAAELLLNEGADPNIKMQPTGSTILQVIIGASRELSSIMQKEAIIVLFSHGADPYIEDDLGENSFDYAERYLLNLEQLEEVKANTEQTDMTKYCLSESQSQYFAAQSEGSRVIRDFGEEKINLIITGKKEEAQENKDVNEEVDVDMDEDEQKQREGSGSNWSEVLSQEMWDYSLKCDEYYEEAWREIEPFYERLCNIGKQVELKVEIVGSFATGLWTRHSDIDIIFINEKDHYVDIKKLLQKIHDQLYDDLGGCVMLHEHFKVPFIKVELQFQDTFKIVQLSIFQRKGTGRRYVKYIRNALSVNPLIRPIFFCFHKILETFKLNRPVRSGLKNYTVFLMICTGLENYPANDLASGLWNVIYYLTNQFQFQVQLDEMSGEYVSKLNMMDPLNPTNNVGGRETDVGKVIQVLEIVRCAFQMMPERDILEYLLSLHAMMSF